MYPKLKFELASLDLERDMFQHFLNDNRNYFKRSFYYTYPELNNKDLDLDKFLKEHWEQIKLQAEKNKLIYLDAWNKIESKFMTTLPKIINTKWFDKNMIAYLSLCTTYPRFIKQKSFLVSWNGSIKFNIQVVATHEIIHFLYFKKYDELFNNNDDSLHSHGALWVLSEIIAPIIANDKRLESIFDDKQKGYDCFYTNKIENKTIMQFFEDKYNEFMAENKKFDDYLIWARDYALNHQKELDVVK